MPGVCLELDVSFVGWSGMIFVSSTQIRVRRRRQCRAGKMPTLRCDYHRQSLIGFARAGSHSSDAATFDQPLRPLKCCTSPNRFLIRTPYNPFPTRWRPQRCCDCCIKVRSTSPKTEPSVCTGANASYCMFEVRKSTYVCGFTGRSWINWTG